MKYTQGTIIEGNREFMIHKAVIVDYLGDDIVAVVLTSTSHYKDNILMKANHFETDHPFGWRSDEEPSYMICQKFKKLKKWGKFKKVGKLTEVGLAFVKRKTKDCVPMLWEDYS